MFNDVVVVSYARTAIGGYGGTLKDYSPIDLASIVIKEAINRANISGDDVNEVIMGCVGQHGINAFLARVAALKAGCSELSSAQTVNRLCASGMQSIVSGALMIERKDAEVIVAGGAESMSNYPYYSENVRWGKRMGNDQLKDQLMDALSEPFSGTHIGVTAENIAKKYKLTRSDLDLYALDSQEKAAAAIHQNRFREQIIPIEIKLKRENKLFDTDEHPRKTSIEKLNALKPIFQEDGVVTAGNASGINDGAGAVTLMSKEKADELGCKPIAKILEYAVSGVDPNLMGMGPVIATKKLLEKIDISLDDIGLIELNEAFASQSIACIQELGLNPEIVNVNGSGISLGHPIGATGTIIIIKLIDEMKKRNIKYGLATLCIGGGQGMSVLIGNI